MKRKAPLAISIVACLSLILWMRALASWHPREVARRVNPNDSYTLKISPDHKFVLTGGSEFYDLEKNRWAPNIPSNEEFYGFAPGGTYFSVQDSTPYFSDARILSPPPIRIKILRRETATGKALWSALSFHSFKDGPTLAVALSDDQKQVLVRNESYLTAFDARTSRLQYRRAVAFFSRGRFSVAGRYVWGSDQREFGVLDVMTSRILWQREIRGWPNGSGTSPDGSLIWIALEQKSGPLAARFYDVKQDKLLWILPVDATPRGEVPPLVFSPNGRLVARRNSRGVEWFESRTGQSLGSRHIRAEAMEFSPDSDFLYTLDKAGLILKWRLT